MVAFVPGISDPAWAPRWIVLMLGAPLLGMLVVLGRPTVGLGAAFAFGAWAALSAAWAFEPLDAGWMLVKLGIAVPLILLGWSLPSLWLVLMGAAAGLAVSSAVLLTGDVAGLFNGKNYLALPAAMVLAGLVAERMWFWAALAAPAALLPMSRTTLVALAAAALPWLWRQSRAGTAALLLAGVAAVAWLRPDTIGIAERLIIWKAMLPAITLTGHGAGSFFALFPSHAPGWDFLASRPHFAHSDVLQVGYEIGLVGLALFAVALYFSAKTQRGPARAMLIVFTVEACFDSPLHFPATFALFCLVLGFAARGQPDLGHALRHGGMAVCDGVQRGAAALGAGQGGRFRGRAVPP